MFFNLAKTVDSRFPNQTRLGTWILNHDNGWSISEDCVTKALGELDDNLGFWTQWRYDRGIIYLDHALLRGYPLWWDHDQQTLTNLAGTGERIWADDRICVHDHDIGRNKIDIIGPVSLDPTNDLEVIARLRNILCKKIQRLFAQTPDFSKRHFATGGIDTTIIKVCLDALELEYQALDHEHFEYDSFTNSTKDILREHYWAYRQIHHWRDTSILLTGSGGDEFLMRSPTTISLWCAWHDIDLMAIFQNREGYHKKYFNRPKNRAVIETSFAQRSKIRSQYPEYPDLVRQICNINANDHQHWHLGNTFTWSPYHDLELTKLMLSLEPQHLLEQFVDATITRRLIDAIRPNQSVAIGPDKNLHARSILNAKR